MLMYKSHFVSSWIACIMKQMGNMCEENVVIPIAAIFYNGFATVDVIKCKREAKIKSASMLKQLNNINKLPWYKFGSKFFQICSLRWVRLKSEFLYSRYQPAADAVENCLKQPEFEYLKYLHKLTERMAPWNSFSGQDCDYEDLPQEFRNVLGDMDPPHAEYSHLCELQKFADHYFAPKMQRTMFIMMLSEKMSVARHVEPPHRA